jgi:hypothetical protein
LVDAPLLKDARNSGEAEAIQRHLLRGEPASWCDQGYAWAEQDAVAWFCIAAFLFVVLPYLIMKIRAWKKGASRLAVAEANGPGRQVHYPNLTSRRSVANDPKQPFTLRSASSKYTPSAQPSRHRMARRPLLQWA